MEEMEKKESKRDLLKKRLSEKYPDKNFDEDEDFMGAISDDYDNYDKELERYKNDERTFSDMFSADPRSAQFLADWKNGTDPMIAFVRRFGTELKDAIDDPERQEELAKANADYLERISKSKQLEDEYAANIDVTNQTIEEWQAEKGIDDEKVNGVIDFLLCVIHDGIVGKFSRETLEMAFKAINHDSDVASAEHVAEVRGRNAKINENKMRRQQGDGMPTLGGANTKASGGNKKENSIFGMARDAM